MTPRPKIRTTINLPTWLHALGKERSKAQRLRSFNALIERVLRAELGKAGAL